MWVSSQATTKGADMETTKQDIQRLIDKLNQEKWELETLTRLLSETLKAYAKGE
jgi:hypothetical protein